LHLLAAHETKRLPGRGAVCVFVRDVDRVHAELVARGANVVKPPKTYDYGMRDFDVLDLDLDGRSPDVRKGNVLGELRRGRAPTNLSC
jgi:hypothetical protein